MQADELEKSLNRTRQEHLSRPNLAQSEETPIPVSSYRHSRLEDFDPFIIPSLSFGSGGTIVPQRSQQRRRRNSDVHDIYREDDHFFAEMGQSEEIRKGNFLYSIDDPPPIVSGLSGNWRDTSENPPRWKFQILSLVIVNRQEIQVFIPIRQHQQHGNNVSKFIRVPIQQTIDDDHQRFCDDQPSKPPPQRDKRDDHST